MRLCVDGRRRVVMRLGQAAECGAAQGRFEAQQATVAYQANNKKVRWGCV